MPDQTPSLDEIRARRAAITPGPWRLVDYNEDAPERDTWLGIVRGAVEIVDEQFQIGRVKYSALPHKENVANGLFIAHAPSDIDVLLSRVEADERRIKELEEALQPFAWMHRSGTDPNELACIRGTASDMTMLPSGDFARAATLLENLDV